MSAERRSTYVGGNCTDGVILLLGRISDNPGDRVIVLGVGSLIGLALNGYLKGLLNLRATLCGHYYRKSIIANLKCGKILGFQNDSS